MGGRDRRPAVRRLGDRAYGRIQGNTTSPYVKLKVADREFDKVKVDEMPDNKQKVAAAMADKYWMDILVRHESHPMVARLVPETPPSALIAIPDLVTNCSSPELLGDGLRG